MKQFFCSLAPHLKDRAGHDHAYHSALKSCVEKLGFQHQMFVSSTCRIKNETWNFFSPFSFSKIFRTYYSSSRLFFIESFTNKELLRVVFAAFFFLKKNDALWILFRYGRHQLPFKGRAHLLLIKVLKFRFQQRFVALTDSFTIEQEFQHQLTTVPIPHTYASYPAPDSLICWWPGSPRKEKGLDEITKISKISTPYKLALSKEANIACAYPLKPVLSDNEYANWLNRCAIVLLPYDPDVYKSGTSGIFVEAVVAGKIPVVKAGSWLARELMRYDLHELIIDWESPKFFTILQRLHNNSLTQAKLKRMQQSYQHYHSIDTFSKSISQLLPSHFVKTSSKMPQSIGAIQA